MRLSQLNVYIEKKKNLDLLPETIHDKWFWQIEGLNMESKRAKKINKNIFTTLMGYKNTKHNKEKIITWATLKLRTSVQPKTTLKKGNGKPQSERSVAMNRSNRWLRSRMHKEWLQISM